MTKLGNAKMYVDGVEVADILSAVREVPPRQGTTREYVTLAPIKVWWDREAEVFRAESHRARIRHIRAKALARERRAK